MNGPLLEVDGLTVLLDVEGARRAVLRDISFTMRPGEAVGLVGESGSGKSMTARAIDRLLPRGAEVHGSIRFGGSDVNRLAGADLRRYRNQVAMIFQDPRAHTNPVRRIGDFMTEALQANLAVSAHIARDLWNPRSCGAGPDSSNESSTATDSPSVSRGTSASAYSALRRADADMSTLALRDPS